MELINIYGVDTLVRVMDATTYDLGDWLCQIMGICA